LGHLIFVVGAIWRLFASQIGAHCLCVRGGPRRLSAEEAEAHLHGHTQTHTPLMSRDTGEFSHSFQVIVRCGFRPPASQPLGPPSTVSPSTVSPNTPRHSLAGRPQRHFQPPDSRPTTQSLTVSGGRLEAAAKGHQRRQPRPIIWRRLADVFGPRAAPSRAHLGRSLCAARLVCWARRESSQKLTGGQQTSLSTGARRDERDADMEQRRRVRFRRQKQHSTTSVWPAEWLVFGRFIWPVGCKLGRGPSGEHLGAAAITLGAPNYLRRAFFVAQFLRVAEFGVFSCRTLSCCCSSLPLAAARPKQRPHERGEAPNFRLGASCKEALVWASVRVSVPSGSAVFGRGFLRLPCLPRGKHGRFWGFLGCPTAILSPDGTRAAVCRLAAWLPFWMSHIQNRVVLCSNEPRAVLPSGCRARAHGDSLPRICRVCLAANTANAKIPDRKRHCPTARSLEHYSALANWISEQNRRLKSARDCCTKAAPCTSALFFISFHPAEWLAFIFGPPSFILGCELRRVGDGQLSPEIGRTIRERKGEKKKGEKFARISSLFHILPSEPVNKWPKQMPPSKTPPPNARRPFSFVHSAGSIQTASNSANFKTHSNSAHWQSNPPRIGRHSTTIRMNE